MKARLLSIICILLMSIGVQAHNLDPLHVDGRYLKNSKGDIVTLHGYLSVLDPYFQAEEYRWEGYDVATCLKNKKAAIDRILASGWKIDYVRFKLDSYWCCEKVMYNGDEYKSFDFERYKKYFEELYLPLIDYYHEKGIYTLLWPPTGPPGIIEVGDEFQEHMMLIWDYVSSHPRIRNNPGVMFELTNEPVFFKCHQGEDYWGPGVTNRSVVFKEVRDYWQPIVDKIRSHCDNVIYIPGLSYQSDYSGFSDYPIKGRNIGYAVHWYPGDQDWELREKWESRVFPIAYKAPIIITETAWAPDVNYLAENDVERSTTSYFGKPLKSIVDELGNVSWNCFEPREDFYYLINSSLSSWQANIANNPEACFKPMYQWWNEYAKTKVMPTSQLKAKKVSLDSFPTALAPGQKALSKIKAEFSNGKTWDVSGDVEYIIEDESVLSVNHGVICGLKDGSTNITVKYTDGAGQVFSRQFKVTCTLFPLTEQGFNPNLHDDNGSFNESTGEYSAGGYNMGGWSYAEGLDLTPYRYLVVQLNHEQQCWASVRIWDDKDIFSDNEAWNDYTDSKGYSFNDATELMIDLKSLHKQNGEPLDLSHIYYVGIWINGTWGSVSIKRVFLSNDGVTPANSYQATTYVYADHKTIYYGDEVPALTYSSSDPHINGKPSLSTTANSTSSVGSYPITIKKGTVKNEQASFIDGKLFVFKALLDVGVQDVTITEGDAIPTFTLTYSGFRNGDTESKALTTKPTAKTTATKSSKAGTYPITISGGKAKNYALTYTQGTLTIKKKSAEPVTITAENKTMTYGDNVPKLTYKTSGAKMNGTPKLSTTATKTSPVGTYPIKVEKGTVTNEQVNYVDGTLTIEKAPLTVGVQDVTITEGDAIPSFTLTYSGFRNSDKESNALTTKPTAKTTATSSSKAGTYPITVSGGSAKNYALTYKQGTLTIKKKESTATWSNILNNSNLEGTDLSCFYTIENLSESGAVVPATIVEGAGKDNSRGIVVQSVSNPEVEWNTMFFICLPQALSKGTRYRMSFDYKASHRANSTIQSHEGPGEYISVFDEVSFTTSWQHYEKEGTVTEEMTIDNRKMRTITFTLAHIKTSTRYYFDNIYFELYTTTDIKNANTDNQREPAIFNLSGQKLSQPQRGINIINGKKVVVK